MKKLSATKTKSTTKTKTTDPRTSLVSAGPNGEKVRLAGSLEEVRATVARIEKRPVDEGALVDVSQSLAELVDDFTSATMAVTTLGKDPSYGFDAVASTLYRLTLRLEDALERFDHARSPDGVRP